MKGIRGNIVKESLIDYENLANTLKENTTNAVKDLLAETVRETYERILSEEDENEYEEEEVKDTEVDATDDEANDEATEEVVDDTVTDDAEETEGDEIEGAEVEDAATAEEPTEEEPVEDATEDEWAEFDKYKVNDGEYDFSQAEDEEIVKVYKLMKDNDEVVVNVDNDKDKIEIKDNSTGAEYLLDLGSDDNDAEGDLEINDEMNESIIYEVALNEYDSNVGYTDNYQKKDVMTNPGMSEPGKNVNDWDAGVPKGTEKPWANKGDDAPFTEKGATKVEEEEVLGDGEETVEEGAGRYGMVQKHTKAKKHIGTNPDEKAHIKVQHSDSTSEDGYKADNQGDVNENFMRKANKILKENKQLKEALAKFKKVLSEAAVTNFNLGQIIKIVTENSTTKEEKQSIIERFGKEAKTIEESKRLYSIISNDLKNNKTSLNINEEKQFNAEGSKQINETQIYQSQDLLNSLDLMHRICD